jgi:hypothetical protein
MKKHLLGPPDNNFNGNNLAIYSQHKSAEGKKKRPANLPSEL